MGGAGSGSGKKPLMKLDSRTRNDLLKIYYGGFSKPRMAEYIGISYQILKNVMDGINGTTVENHKKIAEFIEKMKTCWLWEKIKCLK